MDTARVRLLRRQYSLWGQAFCNPPASGLSSGLLLCACSGSTDGRPTFPFFCLPVAQPPAVRGTLTRVVTVRASLGPPSRCRFVALVGFERTPDRSCQHMELTLDAVSFAVCMRPKFCLGARYRIAVPMTFAHLSLLELAGTDPYSATILLWRSESRDEYCDDVTIPCAV